MYAIRSYYVNAVAVLFVFAVIQLLLSLGVLSRFHSTIIMLICINIILAASLNFSTGFMGQLVLGHAGFMAIGAYTSGLLGIALKTSGMPSVLMLVLCLLAGGLLASLAGIIIGIPALRLRGDYLGIMTLGFAEIVRIAITNLTDLTRGAQGLTRIPTIANFTNVYFIMVICVTAIMMIARSRHGRAIISIKENRITSYNVCYTKLLRKMAEAKAEEYMHDALSAVKKLKKSENRETLKYIITSMIERNH